MTVQKLIVALKKHASGKKVVVRCYEDGYNDMLGINEFNIIPNMETILPSMNFIEQCEQIAKPVNDRIIKNCQQSDMLKSFRDILLPKLVNENIKLEEDKF